jgi:hypothetical protein
MGVALGDYVVGNFLLPCEDGDEVTMKMVARPFSPRGTRRSLPR